MTSTILLFRFIKWLTPASTAVFRPFASLVSLTMTDGKSEGDFTTILHLQASRL